MKNRDIIIGIIVLAASAGLYFSPSIMEDPRAAAFPRVIICIMGGLAVMLIMQSFLLKRNLGGGVVQSSAVTGLQTPGKKAMFVWRPVVFTFVAILVYFALLERLGFYFSSFLFFVVTVCVLDRKNLTQRKCIIKIGGAFIFTAVLYILFKVILVVQTPRGLFM
ncbi:MAG: tripartite tricarboxylate transporter TctB family protein [Desulfatiglandaceae bacterium]